MLKTHESRGYNGSNACQIELLGHGRRIILVYGVEYQGGGNVAKQEMAEATCKGVKVNHIDRH